ncbi:MAG: hypothetical protein ABS76_11455 [Pelagibacterium sp. SCN 64-44]|nr:MAG: hypothetical protein ABS76_11455 [Pelagibacterium sp. SCN 64-44]
MASLTHPFPRVAALGAAGLLALLASGCSMSAFKPAPGKASPVLAQFSAPATPEPAAASAVEATAAEAVLVAEITPSGHVPDAVQVPVAPSVLAYGGSGLDPLIAHYAQHYGVPETLVRRVIMRESNYNPAARNGPYYGLMQISHATATTMGYRGAPGGLLDAETNLRYAVRYLAGAYVTAGGNADQAMRYYARGYYYDAKRAGLLDEAGLR